VNTPRFEDAREHVESWFVRANHPREPKALWLKATVLRRRDGSAIAQAWMSVFDGPDTQAWCEDVPLDEASYDEGAFRVGPLELDLTSSGGESRGSMDGAVSWDLAFERVEGLLGEPLSIMPAALREARLPRNKLVSPVPCAIFSGTLTWGDRTWELADWVGMQGHNWGAAHSPEYAWGHAVFLDTHDGAPVAVMEAASGRVAIGPVTTPLVSMLTIRRDGRELRFDRVIDLWRQHPRIDFPAWTLRMRGHDGVAALTMTGTPEQMVCLNYQNPAGPSRFCLNSKTAAVRLSVTPRNGNAFQVVSPHGGALEFLCPEPIDSVQPVP
jgi:hypothetical protein